MKRILFPLLLAATVASPALAQQLTPTEKFNGFLCCNMRAIGGWISDSNYDADASQESQIFPLGTPIQVTGYGRHRAYVLINGEEYALGNDYSRNLLLLAFTKRYVVPNNPKEKLAQFPPRIQEAIRNSKVTQGMTREQVIMSVGYPMASENPSLDANIWRFWRGSFLEFRVRFDAAGLVDRIDADMEIEHKVIQR